MSSGDEVPVSVASRRHRWTSRLKRYAGRSLFLLSAAATVGLYLEYKTMFPYARDDANEDDEKKKKRKKKALVVPFHRIELKDKHRWDFPVDQLSPDSADRNLKLDVRELVDIIHHAASDRSIVALYGIFGHGSVLHTAGWSDLEEIRNALKVFREAHRTHTEPNISHNLRQVITRSESKPLYAYADTFSSPVDSGNKDYYIASIFTHVHLQQKGELSLLGMFTQQFFLRGLLEKYGILLHVFKHGQYKNFPNMFSEVGWTAAHRENVRNILDATNADVCVDITTARSKALLSSWYTKASNDDIWRRIHESGTFPAEAAWKGGLVDYLPRRDPLLALIANNKASVDQKGKRQDWKPHETDFNGFKAEEVVSLSNYAVRVRKLKRAEERKKLWRRRLHQHPKLVAALSAVGVSVPTEASSKEKIALLYVQGSIGDGQARKTVNAIRKIAQDKDTKCVVLRVSSPGGTIVACETIAEELKGLDVPVVVSFGNVAASGGYYISASARRIFASHKTVTGSIGVFGIRADLTGLTDRYGIKVKYETSGDLSAIFAPFHPMSNKMKRMMMGSIDRYYDQFKGVVSSGRHMSLDDVEAIAEGRVWTGDQAKRNGLVDELGGLYRAIAYARRNFTKTDADIVVWPKKPSLWERLKEASDKGDATPLLMGFRYLLYGQPSVSAQTGPDDAAFVQKLLLCCPHGLPGTLSGAFYAIDEDSALRCLVDGVGDEASHDDLSSCNVFC